jgi:hypothetical protein
MRLARPLIKASSRQWHPQFASFSVFAIQLPTLAPSRSPRYQSPLRATGTKTRKTIDELPQGLQAPLEPFIDREVAKYTPVIDEVLHNQRRFPKCVLLTRIGQFYEVTSFSKRLMVVVLYSSGGNSTVVKYQISKETNEKWTC